MGTRADFYVKSGDELEWLGSIAWDGYPGGIDAPVLEAQSETDFRAALSTFAAERDDWTAPEKGWPWPWDDSDTTDYAYVFVPGVGVVHRDGGYGDPLQYVRSADDGEGPTPIGDVSYTYPDMSARKAVTLGKRSGVIVLGG